MVFTVFRLLTDFVCLYTYEFWLFLCKIVRSSVILLLLLFAIIKPYMTAVHVSGITFNRYIRSQNTGMPNTGGNLKVFESKKTRIKTEKPTNWNVFGSKKPKSANVIYASREKSLSSNINYIIWEHLISIRTLMIYIRN